MKHFRDLVLSTKEPVLHNVLWIRPDKEDRTKYWLYMYEDGWKLLFGQGASSTSISYKVLDTLPNSPDGSKNVVVQFIDEDRDPNVTTNLYPKTRAVCVTLNNGLTVEEAINNINKILANINSNIRKAIYIQEDMLGQEDRFTGKTFFVYSSYDRDNNIYTGEPYLRKYTSESNYTKEYLGLGDIVIGIDDDQFAMEDHRLNVVNTLRSGSASLIGYMTYKDFNIKTASYDNTYLQEVQIDGVNIASGNPRIANIADNVRPVYMIKYDNLDTYYPGTDKVGKTFFFRQNENNLGHLVRYTSTTTRDEIPLVKGDILYNLDVLESLSVNPTFFSDSLYYVVTEGNQPNTIRLIANDGYVYDTIYAQTQYLIEAASPFYVDFERDDEHSTTEYTALTTNTTFAEIYAAYTSGRVVYARYSNQIYPLVSAYTQSAVFTLYYNGFGFQINGNENQSPNWRTSMFRMQPYLNWDTVPTQYSSNAMTSGSIYNALNQKANSSDLNNYVLKSTYDERMEVTPKHHRAEFLDATGEDGEYDVWTGDANNGSGVITDSSTHAESARECFESLWWAVYDNNTNYLDAGTPKLILRKGNVACYCWSDQMSSTSQHSTATQIRLKFFDGTSVITYELVSTNQNVDYPNQTVIEVTKTTQAI